MKYALYLSLKVTFLFLLIVPAGFAQSQTSNTISGFIFDAATRGPVSDIYVELMDDVYTTLRRVKTDGSGRYFFAGISSGNFKVKVLPYGTNYQEEIQEAVITNYSFGNVRTSDNVYLDIYLRLDKRKANIDEFGTAGTVYVQDVPIEARNLFKKAVSQLDSEKESIAGLDSLKKAIEILPNYYDALNKLGIEYVKRKQYFEALPYLIKSVQINQRSFSSYYALGVAAYNLKQIKEAIEAFKAATVINSQSVFAQFQYGRALRITGDYKEAEKSLLKAKVLSKNFPIAEIHWQLGLLYEKTNRYKEAAEELEVFLKIQPNFPDKQQIKNLISQLKKKANDQ